VKELQEEAGCGGLCGRLNKTKEMRNIDKDVGANVAVEFRGREARTVLDGGSSSNF
jgi:hypothetical protein